MLDRPRFWRPTVSATFHGRDLFGPVAAHLARGVPLAEVGSPCGGIQTLPFPAVRARLVPTGSVVSAHGEIVHVDRYGNLIANLAATDLPPDPISRSPAVRSSGWRRTSSRRAARRPGWRAPDRADRERRPAGGRRAERQRGGRARRRRGRRRDGRRATLSQSTRSGVRGRARPPTRRRRLGTRVPGHVLGGPISPASGSRGADPRRACVRRYS